MRTTAEVLSRNRWIPWTPTLKQLEFLAAPEREKLFGGAVGGAKSSGLLMDALMYVDFPGYSAILLRKTYADLALPGALMDMAHDWLGGTGARWNGVEKSWAFPSGATLNFGYLEHEKQRYRYQSSAFSYIGWDELSQFTQAPYLYLMSRLRRPITARIPLRVAGATNPGGVGHDWVYERFVVGGHPDRVFIPSLLEDNPHLDREEYERALGQLDPVTYQQLRWGQWVTDQHGKPFRREFWRAGKNRYDWTDPRIANRSLARWIAWDTAATDKSESAYTSYVVGELDEDYTLDIREVWRGRPEFPELPDVIREVAERWNYDGKLRSVIIENASSGIQAHQVLAATAPEWLRSKLSASKPLGKEHGWAQAGVWAGHGMIRLPEPIPEITSWLYTFEEELYRVPDGSFFDQADALAILVNRARHALAEGHRMKVG